MYVWSSYSSRGLKKRLKWASPTRYAAPEVLSSNRKVPWGEGEVLGFTNCTTYDRVKFVKYYVLSQSSNTEKALQNRNTVYWEILSKGESSRFSWSGTNNEKLNLKIFTHIRELM